MNKQFLTLILTAATFMFGLSNLNAKVWRVNNISGVDADFTSVPAAISGASSGDTLYVEGSYTQYGNITVNKQLTIIGTGYFVTNNDSTQAIPNTTTFDEITISGAAANGTKIYGLEFDELTISSDDVTIQRCYGYTASSSTTRLVYITGDNFSLIQNYLRHGYCSSSSNYVIQQGGSGSGIIANNIVIRGTPTCNYENYAYYGSPSGSAIFVNNTFFGRAYAFNSTLQNNISGNSNGGFQTHPTYPSTLQNNIAADNSLPAGNGNQNSVSYSTIFTLSGSYSADDDYFELKAGSPAIGAGLSGEDCGAYGGGLSYKKSGMPGIPSIFEAIVPVSGNTSTGLNVTIKAKSH